MEIKKWCDLHGCEKEFRERMVKGVSRREWLCSICVQDSRKKSKQKNHEKILAAATEYRTMNRDWINDKRRRAYSQYAITMAEYNQSHEEEISFWRRKYRRDKYHTDIEYKLHHNLSCMIRQSIRKCSKQVKLYLDYSFIELRDHLESLFEPWMTWNNWGKYNVTLWDDNNPATWTWQIDHIIPQSDLLYSSMEDDNFKKCWALDNLRPYSAKLNSIEGAKRARHKQ